MRAGLVPSNDEIFGIIEEIVAQGIRRPAYPADLWVEQYCLQRFESLGFQNVHAEPVDALLWELRSCSLLAWRAAAGVASAIDIPCFPIPHSASTSGLEGRLALFDAESPERAKGNFALRHYILGRLPYDNLLEVETWRYDPEGTLKGYAQVIPFAPEKQEPMKAVIDAGAAAFVGVLTDYPGDVYEYYVPYHGVVQPIPGVWISGSSGTRLSEMMAFGPVNLRLSVDSEIRKAVTHNVMGELPGAGDEFLIIGSHHDAPWASAVEDTSGVALVLAQAEYWSRVSKEERPHNMLFLMNAGHMVGSVGNDAFRAAHQAEFARTVLEVHLEHAAMEYVDNGGKLKATGLPEPRWWFTSRIPQLQAAVQEAIETEGLSRSLILPPTFIGSSPPTDGGRFHLEGVPIMSLLAAPFYLFDTQDTLDKIDREHLAPITRAAIRIIESTRGQTAQSMRAAMQAD